MEIAISRSIVADTLYASRTVDEVEKAPRSLPDKRAIERALRAAGLSPRQSKKLLSGGWRAVANDNGESDLIEALEESIRRLKSS